MKKLMIIALILVSAFINAQEIELPQETREDLGESTKNNNYERNSESNNNSYRDSKHSDASIHEPVLDNVWEIRVEYVLQYEDNGVTNTLAKDDNDYFGYATSFGVAGDNLIWFDREQLKPWENDPEYTMYQADSLKPMMSKVMVQKVGENNYQIVLEVSKGITLLDNSLIAYKLPPKNPAFKVKVDPSVNIAWLLLMGENGSKWESESDIAFVVIDNADISTINNKIKSFKEYDRTFMQGAVLYSNEDAQNFFLSDFIFINNDKATLSKVKYKKELKVIKTEGKNTACTYCCDDFEEISDKKERKAIIAKWEASIVEAKSMLEYETDNNKSKALYKEIRECEAQLEQHKKGFLGIKFLK